MLVPYSHKPSRKPMRLRSDLERWGFLDGDAHEPQVPEFLVNNARCFWGSTSFCKGGDPLLKIFRVVALDLGAGVCYNSQHIARMWQNRVCLGIIQVSRL